MRLEENLDAVAAVSGRVLVVKRGQIGGELPRKHLDSFEVMIE